MSLFRVLSIDGGGIRGVIPARILAEIEDRTNCRICDLFDLIAGTSTGGILTVGLTAPHPSAEDLPRFTASEMLHLYEARGRDIFKRSLWDGITSIGGLADEKYPNDGVEGVLEEYFSDTELCDTRVEVLVTSYDLTARHPYFFKTRRARARPDERNHFLRDVARATAAAPTYFEPAAVPTPGGGSVRYLVDGGVFANNPASCAYVEALSVKPPDDEIVLVSLGTGVTTRPIRYQEAKRLGSGELDQTGAERDDGRGC